MARMVIFSISKSFNISLTSLGASFIMLLMIFFIDGFVLNFSSPHFFSLMGLVIKQNIKELLFIMISLFLISIVVSDHSSLSNKGNNLVKVSSLFITYR